MAEKSYLDVIAKNLKKSGKLKKKKGSQSLTVIVLQPPMDNLQGARPGMFNTGAGPDGIVQPDKVAMVDKTAGGNRFLHEGEGIQPDGNNGVQVTPARQMPQQQFMNDVLIPNTEEEQFALGRQQKNLELGGYKCGGRYGYQKGGRYDYNTTIPGPDGPGPGPNPFVGPGGGPIGIGPTGVGPGGPIDNKFIKKITPQVTGPMNPDLIKTGQQGSGLKQQKMSDTGSVIGGPDQIDPQVDPIVHDPINIMGPDVTGPDIQDINTSTVVDPVIGLQDPLLITDVQQEGIVPDLGVPDTSAIKGGQLRPPIVPTGPVTDPVQTTEETKKKEDDDWKTAWLDQYYKLLQSGMDEQMASTLAAQKANAQRMATSPYMTEGAKLGLAAEQERSAGLERSETAEGLADKALKASISAEQLGMQQQGIDIQKDQLAFMKKQYGDLEGQRIVNDINSGMTFEQIKAKYPNVTQADFNSIKEAGPIGQMDYLKQMDSLAMLKASGDLDGWSKMFNDIYGTGIDISHLQSQQDLDSFYDGMGIMQDLIKSGADWETTLKMMQDSGAFDKLGMTESDLESFFKSSKLQSDPLYKMDTMVQGWVDQGLMTQEEADDYMAIFTDSLVNPDNYKVEDGWAVYDDQGNEVFFSTDKAEKDKFMADNSDKKYTFKEIDNHVTHIDGSGNDGDDPIPDKTSYYDFTDNQVDEKWEDFVTQEMWEAAGKPKTWDEFIEKQGDDWKLFEKTEGDYRKADEKQQEDILKKLRDGDPFITQAYGIADDSAIGLRIDAAVKGIGKLSDFPFTGDDILKSIGKVIIFDPPIKDISGTEITELILVGMKDTKTYVKDQVYEADNLEFVDKDGNVYII